MSASGQLGSYSGSTTVDTGTNKYVALHYVNDSTTAFSKEEAGYRERNLGGSSSKVTEYGMVFGGELLYSAAVLDFDFGAHEYVYTSTDGSGNTTYVTYTPAELLAAGLTPDSEGVDLALVSGDRLYLQGRYWTANPSSVTDTSVKVAGAKAVNVYFVKDANGTWYYSDNVSLSKATATREVSGEVGVFDHLTFISVPGIFTVPATETEEAYNCGYMTTYVYINGVYFTHTTHFAESLKAVAFNIEGIRLVINNDAKKTVVSGFGNIKCAKVNLIIS